MEEKKEFAISIHVVVTSLLVLVVVYQSYHYYQYWRPVQPPAIPYGQSSGEETPPIVTVNEVDEIDIRKSFESVYPYISGKITSKNTDTVVVDAYLPNIETNLAYLSGKIRTPPSANDLVAKKFKVTITPQTRFSLVPYSDIQVGDIVIVWPTETVSFFSPELSSFEASYLYPFIPGITVEPLSLKK